MGMDKIKLIQIGSTTLDGEIIDVAFSRLQVANRRVQTSAHNEVRIETMNSTRGSIDGLKEEWLNLNPPLLVIELEGGKSLSTGCTFKEISNFGALYSDTPSSAGERYSIKLDLNMEDLEWQN